MASISPFLPQAAHLLLPSLFILVPCYFPGTTLQTAHFHLSAFLPLAPAFGQLQISLHRLVLPVLPHKAFPSAASSPCPQPLPTLTLESFHRPGCSSSIFLFCCAQVKLKSSSALCSFHLEQVQEGCSFQMVIDF